MRNFVNVNNIIKLLKKFKGFRNLTENLNKNKTTIGVKKYHLSNNQKKLKLLALKMIDNAKRGILIDPKGKVVKDFNVDMNRMQKVFDEVEAKRINAQNPKGAIHVRISANDIKAVLFKPIVRAFPENENVIKGRTQFHQLWTLTNVTLDDELNELTSEKVLSAFNSAYHSIESFETEILSFLKDNNYSEFIERLLNAVPTAFGKQSPT